ncbi:ABC-type branched-subunit amino acid transport system substrate-binding protein [Chitinivorax tropicus]|uniref:ABC-type branched-subunit amino acid transport system substrate-binding protein n=1 Tax=Chitinivorax tropicus TaxID=714531 RepID=A0A840MFB8_9PROT|nr:ABC transporter substrate-binding protein [Chitinivorax tropicus]MBB5017368.1 ABC-type branched-subunit amino acid transport system substrate-binding protein [Chitinivorax tropicus]
MIRYASRASLFAVCLAFANHALAADDTIVVGQSVALTGPLAENGKELSAGMKAYFDSVNAKGGVNGRKISLLVKDDASLPAKTLQNTQAFITDGVAVLAGYTGTANVALLVRTKKLKDADLSLVGPMTGADSLRAPFGTEEKAAGQGNYKLEGDTFQEGYVPQLFHIRAGYGDEARKIVKQAVSLGMQKMGVLYSDDAFGKSGLAAVSAALREHNLELASKGIYNLKTGDVKEAVKTINQPRPQGVVIIATGEPAQAFVQQYREVDPGAQLFALSAVSYKSLVKALGSKTQGVGISQVVPMPWNSLTPVSKEHQRTMKEFAPNVPLTYSTMEGHIIAKVITEAVRKGGTSRAKMREALEGLKSQDVGGYIVNFNDQERRGSRFVDITVIGREGELMR